MSSIKKIIKVKDFGIFRDFKWNTELNALEKFNVIYGWNGTGKTTLSRIFRSLEFGAIHSDYQKGQFQIELSDGVKLNQNELDRGPNVRVFNVDFIDDNILWKETQSKPILYVGKDNKELSQKIDKTTEELEKKKEKAQKTDKLYRKDKTQYDKILQDEARTIKNALTTAAKRDKFQNYNKRSIEETLGKFNQSNKPKKLDVKTMAETNKIIQGEALDEMSMIFIDFPSFDKMHSTLDELGKMKVITKVMETLKEDQEVSDWVEDGLSLYKKKKNDQCFFCDSKIEDSRITNLEAHFNDAYNEFIEKCDKYLEILETKKIKLNTVDKDRLYSDLREDYSNHLKKLNSNIKTINDYITELIGFVEEKKKKPFEEVLIDDKYKTITSKKVDEELTSVNKVIEKHNEKSKNFDKEIDKKKLELEEHYISIFFDNFEKIKQSKRKLKIDLDKYETERDTLKKELDDMNAKLTSPDLAKKEFNELLKKFLGRSDIWIDVSEDKTGFSLMRGSKPAKNLSEGEKTAFAFIYFIIKLKEKDFKKENTVLVIDDPISSLDSNSLYGAFAFMQSHVKDSLQVIIFTHNFYFLKQVVKWFKRIPKAEGKKRHFSLDAKNFGLESDRESNILEMDSLLKDFHSEYQYLFKKLFDYSKTNNKNLEYYYGVPNIGRKFMETFFGFKDPRGVEISNKIEKLDYDYTKKRRVISFLHANSHSGQEGIETFDMTLLSETPKIIESMFDMIKELDEDHFNGLIESIGEKIEEATS